MSETNSIEVASRPADQAPVTTRTASPDDFLGIAGQRALPTTPVRGDDASMPTTPAPQRSNSDPSADVSMNDMAMSDIRESTESSTTTPGGRKKKNPQKFCCTEYAPCNLSFTRSEHLARHIRKHTGERPFECHCGRRFSRLDNLRQHAQTVHVNEDIPEGSLAASGARFQRVQRTIPAQPASRRIQAVRQGPGHHRGHTRNAISQPVNQMPPMYSNYGDPRRALAPLQMTDPRGPAFSSYPQPDEPYYAPAPYTPPSNRSSGTFDSHYSSTMGSPAFSYAGDRFPPRRQSISSATGPYQGHGSFGPLLPPLHSGTRENFPNSANMFESPTSTAPSQYSQHSRREEPLASDPRRRTWHHRGEFNYMASGLQNVTNTPPEDLRERRLPEYFQTRENGNVQLPPITSFDRGQPLSPLRRGASPAEIEVAQRSIYIHEQNFLRRGASPAEMDAVQRNVHQHEQKYVTTPNLSREFYRMDIKPGHSNDEAGAWADETNRLLDDPHQRAREDDEQQAADVLSNLSRERRYE